jgi:hypothetical protein
MEEKPLVNRVAQSGIVTLNLEDHYPAEEIVAFDLKDYLFHGLILKEKDFREALDALDWEAYRAKRLAVHCSTDAIVPMWAYQLVAVHAQPVAADVYFGTPAQALDQYYREKLSGMDWGYLSDQRVVIKGCSDKPVPASAYLELARLLRPVAKSIMYGEPCSTVPLFKKK